MAEINAVCIDTQPTSGEAILSGTCTGTATVPGGTFALNAGGKGVIAGVHSAPSLVELANTMGLLANQFQADE